MGWWIKKSDLSDEQRNFIKEIKKNIQKIHWINGAAGTGKTTVLATLTQDLRLEYPDASFCYLTYTHALKDLAQYTFREEMVSGVHFLTHKKFITNNSHCDFVFIDEVQDISIEELKTIKRLAKHIVIAGDTVQRIYEHSPEKQLIVDVLSPIEYWLPIMHRLTEYLAKIAILILPNKELLEAKPGNTLANTEAKLIQFETEKNEFIWVIKEATKRARIDKPSCILFSHHKEVEKFIKTAFIYFNHNNEILRYQSIDRLDYKQVNNLFNLKQINIQYLGNGHGDLIKSSSQPMVYVMTYHSSKGLDFDHVFIPQLHQDKQIVLDSVLKKSGNEDLERRLLFVATTRSRCNLFMSYSGEHPHHLVKDLPHVVHVKIQNIEDEDEDEDFF